MCMCVCVLVTSMNEEDSPSNIPADCQRVRVSSMASIHRNRLYLYHSPVLVFYTAVIALIIGRQTVEAH